MTGDTYTAPSDQQRQVIAGNTQLIYEAISKLAGEDLPPGRAGVLFLDGFITRQRERDSHARHDKLAYMAACYLGEAMIADIGGRWVDHPEHGLGILFGPDMLAFPFAKAAKQFENGPEDSIRSFFDIAVTFAAEKRGPSDRG